MPNVVQIKRNTTTAAAPTGLAPGELAINLFTGDPAEGDLYVGDALGTGVIQLLDASAAGGGDLVSDPGAAADAAAGHVGFHHACAFDGVCAGLSAASCRKAQPLAFRHVSGSRSQRPNCSIVA